MAVIDRRSSLWVECQLETTILDQSSQTEFLRICLQNSNNIRHNIFGDWNAGTQK